MYRLKYGASKTKITVVGSYQDMRYISDIKQCHLDQVKVKVCGLQDPLESLATDSPSKSLYETNISKNMSLS